MKYEVVYENADPPRFVCSGNGSHPAAAVYPNGGDQHQAQQHQAQHQHLGGEGVQAAGGLLGQDDLQQRLSAQLGSKHLTAFQPETHLAVHLDLIVVPVVLNCWSPYTQLQHRRPRTCLGCRLWLSDVGALFLHYAGKHCFCIL